MEAALARATENEGPRRIRTFGVFIARRLGSGKSRCAGGRWWEGSQNGTLARCLKGLLKIATDG